jgi:hypothetical protein
MPPAWRPKVYSIQSETVKKLTSRVIANISGMLRHCAGVLFLFHSGLLGDIRPPLWTGRHKSAACGGSDEVVAATEVAVEAVGL